MPEHGILPGAPRGDGTHAPSGPYWHYAIDRARALGIDMSGGVSRFPNTTLAHCLLAWAFHEHPEGQHGLAELIFEAYYAKAIFLDLEALVALASKAGYNAEKARAHLSSKKGEAAVKAEARSSGVSGVPYFIINGKGVFSGAQDPATFEQEFLKASKDRPLPARPPAIYSGPEITRMSIKEIKAVLYTRGVNPMQVREFVEKGEFAECLVGLQKEQLQDTSSKGLRAMLMRAGVDAREMVGVEKNDLIRRLLEV